MDQNETQDTPSDRSLICTECNNKFNFSVGEQAFYAQRGFQDPKRCATCRERAKIRRAGSQRGHMLTEAMFAQAAFLVVLLAVAWLLGGCGAAEDEERCRPACPVGQRCIGRVYPVMVGGAIPSAKAIYACEPAPAGGEK